jgi:DHA3 family macrolide efflux protein-like MFS transporter
MDEPEAPVEDQSEDQSTEKPPRFGATFLTVWFGQVVSLVGSGLTWFGLSIWVFLETGSVTSLAMVLLASSLPRILMSPVAGALVDRWDRRWAMILSDAGSGIGTIVIFILFLNDSASVTALVVVGAFSSVFQAFQWPAYLASITLLVRKENYQRASGMVQMAEAISQLVSPLLAAVAIVWLGVTGLVLIDVITFSFAIVTLLVVRFPRPPKSDIGEESKGSLWTETLFGFKYIYARHGLFALLMFFAAVNFAFGFFGPMLIPFMLSVGSETTLGLSVTIGSTGMLVGSVVASTWTGTPHKVRGILFSSVVLGTTIIALGWTSWIVVIVASMWVGMFSVPILGAMSQAIWMAKVEADVQGRVFAVRGMLAQMTGPLALIVAGPLADKVFVPLMTESSGLGDFLQSIMGSGVGSGYGLFFVAIGIFVIFATFVAWSYGPLRNLETEVPDAADLTTTDAVVDNV